MTVAADRRPAVGDVLEMRYPGEGWRLVDVVSLGLRGESFTVAGDQGTRQVLTLREQGRFWRWPTGGAS